ncbi:acetyl/acyl transferase [Nocardia sp. CDC159]|uniref:Acetyl/acyl transferase n=1 Tax=Nocardia pulmonis TaxID=2951408 RepID=A0A9X2E633_9NOCA|nr:MULTISPECIES: DapH/DapD/GlmU-related protein [Nocardia]MCM6774499.1 acetyl/acyl transferase [Nocardia pulmonis]MCM6787435.1 acetyl/acyl transferase [Nocardia sp. CDC159]
MKVEELYAPVRFGDGTVIGEQCVLGYPKEARIREAAQQEQSTVATPVVIGDGCLLFNQVIVHEGTALGSGCVVEDRARIGYDCAVGDRSRLAHGAYICDRVRIGADACVAGFVCDATTIGDRSTVMGDLVHEYTRPDLGWWGVDEAPPVVEHDSVVGFGARVVGGVRIGPYSYVAAGAVVTRDVPPEHVATGTNVLTPLSGWRGRRLAPLIDRWTGNSHR